MKLFLTTTGPDLHSELDPRFGRCAYLLLIDSETLEFQSFPNPSSSVSGGAGIKTAQFVADLKPDTVISGDFGPNAASALRSANIPMYLYGDCKTVEDVVRRLNSNSLKRF